MNRWQWALLMAVLLSVSASALALVYMRQENRTLFVHQQELNAIRDAAEVEWGRLQLEQATLADIARVERIARETLKMKQPQKAQVIMPDLSTAIVNQSGGRQ